MAPSQLERTQAVAKCRLIPALAVFPQFYRCFIEERALGVPKTRFRDHGTRKELSRSYAVARHGLQRISHFYRRRVLTARPPDPAPHLRTGERLQGWDGDPDLRLRGIQDVVSHFHAWEIRGQHI